MANFTQSPTITTAGLSLAVSRNNQSLSLNISHISLGTSKYNPTGRETALKTQKLRVAIASATKISDKTVQIRISAKAEKGKGFLLVARSAC